MAQFTEKLKHYNFNELPFMSVNSVLAIDVSANTLKLLQISFGAEKAKVDHYIQRELPADFLSKSINSDERKEMIKESMTEIITEHGIKAKYLLVMLSGGAVFSRKIRIPKLSAKELEDGIKWEASNQIPFSLDSSYLDWFFLREVDIPGGAKNDEFMITACAKEGVDEFIDIAGQLNLHPICIGIPLFSLFNLVRISPQFEGEETIALLDIGAKKTNIVIVKDRQLLFSREIPIGDDSFNEVLINEFTAENWDVNIVEKIKREKKMYKECLSNVTETDDVITKRIVEVIRPLLEKMMSEIRRSFDYYREHFDKASVERIVLSGKGALHDDIDEVYSKIFKVPVEFINMGELVNASKTLDLEAFNNDALDLVLLLGLAVGKTEQINFVPKKYQERLPRIAQMVYASILGALILIVFVGMTVNMNLKINAANAGLEASNRQMSSIIPKIQQFNQSCILYSQDKTYYDNLKSRQLLLSGALREISNICLKAIAFDQIEIKEDGWLQVIGVVFDDEENDQVSETVLTDFIVALEQSPIFKEVKLVSSDRGDRYEVPHSKFEIMCRIVSRNDIKGI